MLGTIAIVGIWSNDIGGCASSFSTKMRPLGCHVSKQGKDWMDTWINIQKSRWTIGPNYKHPPMDLLLGFSQGGLRLND